MIFHRKWSYLNRKWNNFSKIQASYQNIYFNNCFLFLPRSSKLIWKQEMELSNQEMELTLPGLWSKIFFYKILFLYLPRKSTQKLDLIGSLRSLWRILLVCLKFVDPNFFADQNFYLSTTSFLLKIFLYPKFTGPITCWPKINLTKNLLTRCKFFKQKVFKTQHFSNMKVLQRGHPTPKLTCWEQRLNQTWFVLFVLNL